MWVERVRDKGVPSRLGGADGTVPSEISVQVHQLNVTLGGNIFEK